MANMKNFFMNNINVVEDVRLFIEEDFPILKDVKAWKSDICTKLISEIYEGASEDLVSTVFQFPNSMKSICGKVLAEMILLADDKSFVLNEDSLSEKQLISALEKAKEIVVKSDEYDELNFINGFEENVKEMVWLLCVAGARQERLKKEAIEKLNSVESAEEKSKKANTASDYGAAKNLNIAPGWENAYEGPLEKNESPFGFEVKPEESVEKNTESKKPNTDKEKKKCHGDCENNCKCCSSCKNCEGCDTPEDDDSPYGIIGFFIG